MPVQRHSLLKGKNGSEENKGVSKQVHSTFDESGPWGICFAVSVVPTGKETCYIDIDTWENVQRGTCRTVIILSGNIGWLGVSYGWLL